MEGEGILQDNLDSSRVMVMVMVMMMTMMTMIVVMLLLMMVRTTDDDVDDVLTGELGKLSDLPGHP